MVIIRSLEEITTEESCVVTIGTFDGIHIGHSTILQKTVDIANRKQSKSVVITFNPHPKKLLCLELMDMPNTITDFQTKIELIEGQGIDYILVIPFDEKIAKLSAEEFLKDLVIDKFQPTDIVIGYDHHFGFKQRGNAEFLKLYSDKFGFVLHTINPILVDCDVVSSTKIRYNIGNNNISYVNKMIGRPFQIRGRVEKGEGRGKLINFPTANIVPIEKDQIIPSGGVFCVTIDVDGITYKGMCNIGYRPTFEKVVTTSVIEVNVFSEEEIDLYNKEFVVKFHKFVRDEKKFDSAENLKEQLQIDKVFCKKQLIEV